MKSEEAIRSIHNVYERFKVIRNLQEHLMRAAGIAELICDNWKGPAIEKSDVVAALLLHDVGNTVKMDFRTEEQIKMMGDEAKRVEYWIGVQNDIIKKYGTDDHIVTEKMIDELGIDKRVKDIITGHIFANNKTIVNSNDWEIKIAAYADQRVGPYSVMTLEERFKELKERYAKRNKLGKYSNLDELIEYSFEIEKQLLTNMTTSADKINDKTVKKYIKKYQSR